MKQTHASHAHTATAQQQQVLVMSQPSSSYKAPRTDKAAKAANTDESNDDHSNSSGSLHRPGEPPPTREGMSAPAPAAVAQLVQREPPPRAYPPSFEVERSVGSKGRPSYTIATHLRVIDQTRFRCNDGGVVGNGRATTGLGRGTCFAH